MPTCLKANYWSAQRSGCGVRLLHLRIFVGLGGGSNGQLTDKLAKNYPKVCAICWRKCSKMVNANRLKYINEFSIENYNPQHQLSNLEYFAFLQHRKTFFSGLFKCTIILLGTASGETSDISVIHCLSTPVFIERVCALRGIDSSEAKIQVWNLTLLAANSLPCT